MRFIYSFLFYCAVPFIFLRLLWRSRHLPTYRQGWFERMGFPSFRLSSCIWVHAVSLGETIAAIPLIQGLQNLYPSLPILVTNMTPTGAARVKGVFGSRVYQAYVPYDLPGAIRRFLLRVHPKILIVMETELWPNLFALCKKRHIPILIANARLSKKSAHRYKRIPHVTHELLNAIDRLAAQSALDARYFTQIGLDEKKIKVTGNLKFELMIPEKVPAQSQELRMQLGVERFIWIAASTHPSEENIILSAHKKIQQKIPSALLILVPRHPDRFETVAHLLKKEGMTFVRRSEKQPPSASSTVYLGDTVGELLLMYGAADVVFVGGSFLSIGGHNMLEPAALGLPILTGPHVFNFVEISSLLQTAGGLFFVQNEAELVKQVLHFFQNPSDRVKAGQKAREVVEQNKGSLTEHLTLIASLLRI